MSNPNVKEIIGKWLKENGYDGLYDEGGCACTTEDIAPCGYIGMDCIAGYLQEGCGRCDMCEGEITPCNFHIPDIDVGNKKTKGE